MTPTGYLMARAVQSVGLHFRKKRMFDAAVELNLLLEAEEILGRRIWKETSGIKEISVEYWHLRKFTGEYLTASGHMKEAQEASEAAHAERCRIAEETTERTAGLQTQRDQAIRRSARLSARRDEIIKSARDIRRRYEGNRIKIRVLTEENPDSDELDETTRHLQELKEAFNELKQEREQIGRKMDESDAEVSEIEARLAAEKDVEREWLTAVMTIITRSNRKISLNKSRMGLLESSMKERYCNIGRYISRNFDSDPACAKAAKSERQLVRIMEAIRASMKRNEALSGRA